MDAPLLAWFPWRCWNPQMRFFLLPGANVFGLSFVLT
jgi:hypothetical protein